jgi:hypothetical protein
MLVGSVAEGVEVVMGPALILMGVSHIVRPDIWSKLFAELHAMGSTGVIYRTFMLELWPAMAIVTLHQVWSGPGIALTLYGTLLALKCAVAVLFPEIGGRSMVLARGGARSFVPGGIMLVALGGSCIWALLT